MTENTPRPISERVPPWTRLDTIAIGAAMIAATCAHFWQLGVPDVLVYDEHIYVEEAYKFLRGQIFFEVHPQLAIWLIAAFAKLFGCHAWSWRIGSAVIGTALIPLTYLLARRMFQSRGAAILAALLMLCEGMFLQYSRLALINIVYLTTGAAAYLALFRFMQLGDAKEQRRCLLWIGVLLGLGLGSKFAIPGVTWLLVVGFLLSSILSRPSDGHPQERSVTPQGYAIGAVALIGGVSGIILLLTFLPYYAMGWWTGIADLTTYYHRVLLANKFYPEPLSHQDSPWWSWPLMLRAYRLWQTQDDMGMLLDIWGGGNPLIWWAALVAIVIACVRALRESSLSWKFIVIGYVAYLGMFIPIHRSVYLYSYLPAYYLAILALAALLDGCWKETTRAWEEAALLLPVFAVSVLGLGYLYGAIVSGVTAAGYGVLHFQGKWSGKFVCAVFVIATLVVFFYFLPLWIPMPMMQDDIDARLWLSGAGLANWK
jgi:dolichyl-phosphate-mannose--protein O-mannosyl transferase